MAEEMIQRYVKEHTEHELEISRFTELEPITEAKPVGQRVFDTAMNRTIEKLSHITFIY